MPTPYKDKSTYMDDISVAAMRRKYGLSQAELAAHLGVSRHTVAQWEKTPGYVPKIVELAIARVKDLMDDTTHEARMARAASGDVNGKN